MPVRHEREFPYNGRFYLTRLLVLSLPMQMLNPSEGIF